MAKAIDLTGMRFGKLVALERATNRGKKTYWLCQCDCGNKKEVQTCHLTSGKIRSCGCINNILTHGETVKGQCLICGNEFETTNLNRRYCYECSPEGLSSADSLRTKKRIIKHKLIEYKGGKCEKCGYQKCEAALQFHHKNPKEKDFTISTINLNMETLTMRDLYKEADKCALLCANCHAEEHYNMTV